MNYYNMLVFFYLRCYCYAPNMLKCLNGKTFYARSQDDTESVHIHVHVLFLSNLNTVKNITNIYLMTWERVVFFKVLRKFCAERMRTNTQRSYYHRGAEKHYCVHLCRANSNVAHQFTIINEQWSIVRWLADEPNLIVAEKRGEISDILSGEQTERHSDNTQQNHQKSKHIFR